MDCRTVEFSPEKSQERINKALQVFPRKGLLNNKLPNFIISWARYCNSIPHEMYCV